MRRKRRKWRSANASWTERLHIACGSINRKFNDAERQMYEQDVGFGEKVGNTDGNKYLNSRPGPS